LVEMVKLANGWRTLLKTAGPETRINHQSRREKQSYQARRNQVTDVLANLKALTMLLIRSNLRSSQGWVLASGWVTDRMTRNVVFSKRTTSEAEVTLRKWDRWDRSEASEGIKLEITTDHA